MQLSMGRGRGSEPWPPIILLLHVKLGNNVTTFIKSVASTKVIVCKSPLLTMSGYRGVAVHAILKY